MEIFSSSTSIPLPASSYSYSSSCFWFQSSKLYKIRISYIDIFCPRKEISLLKSERPFHFSSFFFGKAGLVGRRNGL